MYRILIILSIALILKETAIAQVKPVSFEELRILQAGQPRPVAVLIMTNWCKYCHAMKNSMLKNKGISAILAGSFYVIFLDAEEKRDIYFAGKNFKFKPSGLNTGLHELAEQLGTINGQIAWPSLCFLNNKNEIIYQYDGFLNSTGLNSLLKELSVR